MKGLERTDDHRYFYRGRRSAGVTSVLEPYTRLEFTDQEWLAYLARRGQLIHETVHLYNIGELDEGSLDPLLVPYLNGWKNYLAASGFKVIESERYVYSKKYNFAGQLDTLGSLGRSLQLTDIKTGSSVPRTVGPQTAAYAEAYKEETGRRVRMRRCVHLDGSELGFKLHMLGDENDWNIFKAALIINRWHTAGQPHEEKP